MREDEPSVRWLFGGVVIAGALPAAMALAMGILLQTAVAGFPWTADLQADDYAAGRRQQGASEGSRVGIESPGEWRWPVRGRLTARYGGCTFAMCPHWGIDIAGAPGTPVVAAGDGVVAAIGWDPDGYGHYIILAHKDGWQTLYAHLDSPHVSGRQMKLNQAVLRGDPIGALGSSGASTGPHLHLEMRHAGIHVDPTRVLPS